MAAVAPSGPPGAPAAITVTMDLTLNDWPLLMNATEQLVAATPFLRWVPVPAAGAGVQAQMRIPQYRAIKVFLRRCNLNSSAADQAVLSQVNCVEFGLTAACWGRLLTNISGTGIFLSGPYNTWPAFLSAYMALDLQNVDLTINAADLQLGESFDAPAIPAVPGIPGRAAARGRAAVPAVPPRAAVPAMPGPVELELLSLVTLGQIVGDQTEDALEVWADLVGALGPCYMRAARLQAASAIQIHAAMLHHALAVHLLGPGSNPSAQMLAQNVLDFLKEATLARCILPSGLSDSELKFEFRDRLRKERHSVSEIRVFGCVCHGLIDKLMPYTYCASPFSTIIARHVRTQRVVTQLNLSCRD